MIAVTAYTDPFIYAVTTNEAQPLYDPIEPQKNEEDESFAEILAGLLQNSAQPAEISETENSLDAFLPENFVSNVKFDIHTLLETSNVHDNIHDIEFENIFDLPEFEIPDIELSQVLNEIPHIDLTSGELLQEFQDIYSDLFAQSLELDQGEQNFPLDKSKQELARTRNNNSAAQMEFSASMIEGADTETMQQAFASQDAIRAQADNDNIKDRANPKANNATLAETNTLSTENPAERVSAVRQDEKAGRLDEMRSRSRRDKVTVEVRDMRTEADAVSGTQARTYTTAEAARTADSGSVQELTLELRLPDYNGGQAGQSAQVSWEAKSGAAFENMLARELHQNFNGDIVRHASVALRDGGESTIKLTLHPESLGNVKIRLEMTENKITGHIIVESKEALNAFREQIAELEQAFRDSGFADAALNLSLTADGSGTQQHGADILESQQVTSIYEDSLRDSAEVEAVQVEVYFGQRQGKVNMLA